MTDLSLLQDFVTETVEHLEEMEGNLLQLETDPENREILNEIFRSVHTIKGAAEYLGMERIAELSHKLENLLDLMRNNEQPATRDIIDVLMAAHDRIGLLTADVHQSQAEQTDIEDLLARIAAAGRIAAEDKASPSASGGEDGSQPAAGQADALSESEIYEEEHDEELFGIFLEQLQEGLDALQSWTDTLHTADRVDRIELLGRCLAQLDPLRSSANYMGYDKLIALYDAWQAAIRAARERLNGGDEHFMPHFLDQDMQARIETIGKTFPRLTLRGPSARDTASPAEDTFAFIDEDDAPTEGNTASVAVAVSSPAEMEDDLFSGPLMEETAAHGQGEPEENAETLPPPKTGGPGALEAGLLQDFIAETVEHLGEMESSLLQLEASPGDTESLNSIFRSVHTIKGAAEYMGMGRTADLAHHLESLLDHLRKGRCPVDRDTVDLVMSGRDRIAELAENLDQTGAEQADTEDLLSEIRTRLAVDTAPSTAPLDNEQTSPAAANTPDQDAALEREIYEEENDEELFGIFLDQLQEGLDAIHSWSEALRSAEGNDRGEILKRCLAQIDPLRSSANYMGYRKLTGLYDRWTEAVQTAQERLERKEEAFLPAFIDGCLKATVDDIRRCFPRLQEPDAGTDESVADAPGEAKSGADRDPLPGHPSDLLDVFAETAAAAPSGLLSPSSVDEAPVDGSLFDRLSRSFDRRMAENEQHASAAPPSGMEGELFSTDGEQASPGDDLDRRRPSSAAGGDPLAVYAEGPESFPLDAASGDSLTDGEPCPADVKDTSDTGSSIIETTTDQAERGSIAEAIPSAEPVADGASGPASGDTDTDPESPPEASEQKTWGDAEPTQDASEKPDLERETVTAFAANPIEIRDPDRSPDNRRNAFREGRRKSDRIGEKLLRQSIRVDAVKIDALMNQVGELVVSRAWFSQLFHEMRDLQQSLQHHAGLDAREMKQVKGLTFRLSEATVALGRVANELQEGVMKVRMLPIAQLFNRYPRLVYDLVREGDKKVALDIKGEETELDKMVIEAISDPLIHIIRNAVDHGIEASDERRALGKPESGTIHLEAYHEGNHVVIEIADDGRGLDVERIKAKAVAGHFASREEIERMPAKELNAVIMLPGFSTAAEVTHTSGRGVGMDVVKQNIEKLNGTIEIDTTPGVGTQFRIKIPLTLAIIPALLVQVGSELFTIPLSTVEETIRLKSQDLSTIEGVEVMQLRESTLPLVRLAELFNMPSASSGDGRAFVVVVSTGMKQVGLVVDGLLGQEEVVIKPLEDYLQEKSGFSGATILGDGRISLILDIYELVNLSMDRQSQRKRVALPA